MNYAHRRCSSSAIYPYVSYREHMRRPSSVVEQLPIGMENEISSEATVVCEDSEAEEDLQSILYGQNSSRFFENRYVERQQGLPYSRTANLPFGFGSFSTGGFPFQLHPNANCSTLPPEVLQRELFERRRGPRPSWGFQQDMADYEASLQNPMGCAGPMIYPPPTNGFVMRNEIQPKHNRRKSKSGKKESVKESKDVRARIHEVSSEATKPTKSRRRGRRGGRGKKSSEHPADVVPKLEQNLEAELAKEMANHVSNKSALAQSFSSLRLHVAGGGTMIILNDKEITNGSAGRQGRETIETKQNGMGTEPLPTILSQDIELGHEEDSASISRSKGCGAFFPPQILQHLHREQDPSFSSPLMYDPLTMSGFHIPSNPYVPTEFVPSEKLPKSSSRGKAGTGCFIPSYSHDASPEMDTSQMLESVSFGEKLDLENSEELFHSSTHPSTELFEAMDLCSNVSTPEREKQDTEKMEVLNKRPSSQDEDDDAIHMIDNHAYTTFTSPLHAEFTPDRYQAEKEKREEVEQKLVELQIVNDELQAAQKNQQAVDAQLRDLKMRNFMLQLQLLEERKKHRRSQLYNSGPLGLSTGVRKSVTIHEKTESGIEKEGCPNGQPTKTKRPKSQLKSSTVSKPVETKQRLTKPEKKTSGSNELSSLKTAGTRKPALRTLSRNCSDDDLEPKKHKKSLNKTVLKHSRAASSLRP